MSDQSSSTKIMQLRTFATDAKQARLLSPTTEEAVEMHIQPKEIKPATERKIAQDTSDLLTKEIAHIAKPERSSILSDSGINYESEGANEGVIIRDKKRKRFKLLPAMIEASTSWFTGIQDEQKKRAESIPKVKTAESRIEVIEEAVRGSEQAPKEDYAFVAEHLKNTERVPISTAISFKEKSEVPKPTWSSLSVPTEEETNVEPTAVQTEAPQIQEEVVIEVPKAQEQTLIASQVETPQIEVTDVREQVIDTALDALFDSKEETILAEEPVIEIELPEQIVPPVAVPEVTQELETEVPHQEVPYIPSTRIPAVEDSFSAPQQYAQPRENTNRKSLYVYLLIGVIIMSSLGGVLVTYYLFSLTKTSPVANSGQETQIVSVSLVQEQSSKIYTMPKTATEHILEIQKNIASSQAVTRFIPNLQIENGAREATVEEILISLSLTAPASFLRSIKEVTLGGVDGTDMFIVLRVSTFDTAFAGMLSWEETIQSDFSPLFNTNQSRALTFTDTLTSNKNARLLKDNNGDDVIAYTFTDKNTILITSTRTILERLIPLVK